MARLTQSQRKRWEIIKYTYTKEYKRNQTLIGKGRALQGSNEAFQSCYNFLRDVFNSNIVEGDEDIALRVWEEYWDECGVWPPEAVETTFPGWVKKRREEK